ncbi:MAG: HAMP domain-containing histidine kinase [Okeania sp. SIO1H6]|nr:HAMP domain-containing histidine kinase [Okeania sp. SIO1H6]
MKGKTYLKWPITLLESFIIGYIITTELSEDKQKAIVRIADNGMGMPEDVKAKIFQQGFTTKEVGKGTGLGMAFRYAT